MSRLGIAFDLDGVLSDFCRGFSDLIREGNSFINPFRSSNVLKWDMEDKRIPKDIYERAWGDIRLRGDTFWLSLEPVDDFMFRGVPYIKMLEDQGADFWVITSRESCSKPCIHEYVKTHLDLKIPHSNIVICHSSEKWDVVDKNPIHYFIDDSPTVFKRFLDEAPYNGTPGELRTLFVRIHKYNLSMFGKLSDVGLPVDSAMCLQDYFGYIYEQEVSDGLC